MCKLIFSNLAIICGLELRNMPEAPESKEDGSWLNIPFTITQIYTTYIEESELRRRLDMADELRRLMNIIQ